MRIEDVSLADVQRAWESNRSGRGRAKSPDALKLIEAITKMRPGEARAVGLTEGQTLAKLKSQVTRAAKDADKSVDVVADEINQRVMFAVSVKSRRKRRAN